MSLSDCLKKFKLDEFETAIINKVFEGYSTSGENVGAAEIRAVEERLLSYQNDKAKLLEQIREKGGDLQEKEFSQKDEEEKPRASFRISPHRKAIITLFADRDLSSFIHESGHLFLEIFGDVAVTLQGEKDLTPGQQSIVADYERLLKWFKVEKRDDIKTEHHEKFARGYEAYMAEGKAPSVALRGAFARFRSWISFVYRIAQRFKILGDKEIGQALDVQLNNDVRAVMDRMIATEESIEAAEKNEQLDPFFSKAEDYDMSDAEFANYKGEIEKANTLAKEKVQQMLMKDWNRQNTNLWKERLKTITDELTTRYSSEPIYKALFALQKDTAPDGSVLDDVYKGHKFNRKELTDRYGKEDVARLPKGITSANNKETADDIASLFDFESGDQLIQALLNIENLNNRIKKEAKFQVENEFGNMLLDGSLDFHATNEVMNNHRDEIIKMEMEYIRRKANQASPFVRAEKNKQKADTKRGFSIITAPVPSQKELNNMAKSILEHRKIRELRPGDYLIAQRKAAKLAVEMATKNEYEAAYIEKHRQRLNIELYKESIIALEKIGKNFDKVRSFNKTKVRQKIGKAGGNHLELIDSIINQYEFNNVSLKKLDHRQALKDYVAKLNEDGTPHSIPPDMVENAQIVNYKNLTLMEFNSVVDALKSIEHLAVDEVTLIKKGERIDLEEKTTELASAIVTNLKDRIESVTDEYVGQKKFGNKLKAFTQDYLSSLRTMNFILREIDGEVDFGPAYQIIKRDLDDAYRKVYYPRLEKEAELLKPIYELLKDTKLKEMINLKTINRSFSKEALIMVAMNLGTESNVEAFLDGGLIRKMGIDRHVIHEIKSLLTQKEWQFVEGIWRFYERFRPEISQTYIRRTGVSPEMIEGIDVETPFGVIKGGYAPLKYDKKTSVRSMSIDINQLMKDLKTGIYTQAHTKHGFAKERKGSAGQDVILSLGVIPQHLNEVILDLSIGDEVRNTAKILKHKTVASAFTEVGQKDLYDVIDVWLHDIAVGEIVPKEWYQKMAKHFRVGTTISALSFNVGNALIQPTGLMQAMVVVGKTYMLKGLGDLLTRPWVGPNNIFDEIARLDPRMKRRQDSINQDITAIAQLAEKSGLIGTYYHFIHQYALFMMKKTQWIVDVITWLGAYRRGIDEHNGDITEAIAMAGYLLSSSQGSGDYHDKTGMERGTVSHRTRQSMIVSAMTGMMAYVLLKYNIIRGEVNKTNWKNPGDIGIFIINLNLIFMLESILVAFLKGKYEDDKDWKDLLKTTGRESLFGLMGMFPVLGREVAGSIQGFTSNNPIESGLVSTVKGAKSASDISGLTKLFGGKGKVDEQDFKDLISAFGIIFHAPVGGQANRIINEMNDRNPSLWQVIFGEPPKKNR